ncbi:hypothetical protein [uncultured Caulobacter sp.]|uniref:hypothetical protein n=1 Tax=uncultured Caulobacter sp. TaxID=158749 RepID=UPI002637E4F0|nr:hypothetical protein [uncultured Caulobacter sp.]
MTPEDQLAAFLGEVPRQGRAELFTAEVIRRIERQVLIDRLTTAAAGAMVFALVLWACAPMLNQAVAAIAPGLAPVAAVLAFTAAVAMVGGSSVFRRL